MKKKLNHSFFYKKDTFTSFMKKVSILGCGWLGKALANTLLQKGYDVNGSVRSEEKSIALKNMGVTPYLIEVENSGIVGDFESFISDADILVTAFPPGIRKNANANYTARIKHILMSIPSYSNCNLLHLSSVGVFGAMQGNVNETTQPKPESAVGKQLLEVEEAIMSLGANAAIVRLAGLVGDGRHPVKQLTGKIGVSAPMAPTNLVHQKDVVTYLAAVIKGNYWGQTLHCVSPLHHQRGVFYTQECEENGLAIPQFSYNKSNRNKKVLDTKSAELFGFYYKLAGCHFKDCR